ncbi:Uncharacterised protein [Shigella sonnei]|nr:Uncharacterised protein [Shigella sonnei]
MMDNDNSLRFSTALQENAATSLPYLPVIIHTQQEAKKEVA